MRRTCDNAACRRPLVGKRGHGFPTRDGKRIECASCAFPQAAQSRAAAPDVFDEGYTPEHMKPSRRTSRRTVNG